MDFLRCIGNILDALFHWNLIGKFFSLTLRNSWLVFYYRTFSSLKQGREGKFFQIRLYHILSIFHDCTFFCHQDLRYGITVHSFHSLEENIGDICDDLQKMCFVVVFLKKKFFSNLDKSSMYLIGLTDSSKGVKLTSRPKDQLKIVLCTSSSQSGTGRKNCCVSSC